ncbi:MAG: phytanoyl-CoA dioxygenase, partial [Mesorhizobium sp.]
MAHAKNITKDDHPTSSRATTQLSKIRKVLPLRVLSDADFA